MPWYKFSAHHGGGHQSKSEEYVWFDTIPDNEQLEIDWDDWVINEQFENPVGDAVLIAELPENVKLRKISEYERCIERAKRMLQILEEKV